MVEPFIITLVSATVVSVAVCVYKVIDRVVSAPRELVQESSTSAQNLITTFSAELRKILGSEPQISVRRRVVQNGGAAVRELALYKETILISEEWRNTSWRSTKNLDVQQPFVLKAGFDLNRLKVDLDPESKRLTVSITESTLVNVEYAGEYEVLKEEHGLWNRISQEERDAVMNSLPLKAREEAERLKLRDKAAEQLRLFLSRMVPERYELVVECKDETLDFKEQHSLESVPGTALQSWDGWRLQRLCQSAAEWDSGQRAPNPQ